MDSNREKEHRGTNTQGGDAGAGENRHDADGGCTAFVPTAVGGAAMTPWEFGGRNRKARGRLEKSRNLFLSAPVLVFNERCPFQVARLLVWKP